MRGCVFALLWYVCVCVGGGCPHRRRSFPFDRLVNRLIMCAKNQSNISATGPLEGSWRL